MNQNSVIPVLKPVLPRAERIRPYLENIDETNIYSNFGPLVTKLEHRIADFVSVRPENVVVMSSATSALEGALTIQKLRGSTAWALPSWTFTATVSAALRAGVSPNFLDITDDWKIRKNSNDSNLIEVLPFGAKPEPKEYCNRFQSVIMDGAASYYQLEGLGESLTDNAGLVVSLHATKSVGAGEGGIFISLDTDWVEQVRSWSNFGFNSLKESVLVGTNAKMSEYSAAVAHASLDDLPSLRELWKRQIEKSLTFSQRYRLETTPALSKLEISPYWLVKVQSASSKKLLEQVLDRHLIQHRNWWGQGCHQMEAFSLIPQENLLNTDHFAKTTLALPMHLALSERDWSRIDSALSDFAENEESAH